MTTQMHNVFPFAYLPYVCDPWRSKWDAQLPTYRVHAPLPRIADACPDITDYLTGVTNVFPGGFDATEWATCL